jgi:hypothetical protein
MEYPPFPSKKNSKGHLKDIDGLKRTFTILDEIVRPQTSYPQKMIILQKIQFDDSLKIELRLAYYIIGKQPAMVGKWVFGQYATFIPEEDFQYIVNEAKQKGWLKS